MGIRSSLNSIVSRPMEGAIRELIEEVLASRSFVRPGEIASLRQEVAELGSQDTAALEARIQALEERLAQVQAALEQASTPAPSAPASKRPAPAKGDRGCKVPDCTASHRARGFCGKHYQMLRRSTLPGFAGPDGRVPFEDGSTWQVSESHYGEPAQLVDGAVLVDGQAVEAALLEG